MVRPIKRLKKIFAIGYIFLCEKFNGAGYGECIDSLSNIQG